MSYFIGVYGYDISYLLKLQSFHLTPITEISEEARRLATNQKEFKLTAIVSLTETAMSLSSGALDRCLHDLEAALIFCQQQWIKLSHGGDYKDLKDALNRMPSDLGVLQYRPCTRELIMPKFDLRERLLNLCLEKLADEKFDEKTHFRKAFFRNVESLRLNVGFVDLTYYLTFSALEMMARRSGSDYDSSASKVLYQFLHGKYNFDVYQDCPRKGARSLQRYACLRNALFHNGNWQCEANENGQKIILKLEDYISNLERLLPDVLLRVIDYDDEFIHWERWIDRWPWAK